MVGCNALDSRMLCSQRQSFGHTGHTDVQPERTGFSLEHKSVRVPHGSGVQLHQPEQGKYAIHRIPSTHTVNYYCAHTRVDLKTYPIKYHLLPTLKEWEGRVQTNNSYYYA